jgi:hypothetical protein
MTGGFRFPDGTTQTTAATSGVSLSSPDSSITVGGTAVAPTVAVNTTNIQERVSGACTGGSAIASVGPTGTVSCQTVSGGGAVTLPVSWTSSPNPPSTAQGVLNVTNTAVGIPNSSSGTPNFADVPAAIVGVATGSQTTTGVAGIATGGGVGVFAEGFSQSPSLAVFNMLTGYTSSSDTPSAIEAHLENVEGAVIKAKADSATAPVCTPGSSCQQLTGVEANLNATSGTTVGFSANLSSPASQGLNLNFNVAPTSGWMINAGVNGSTPTYFQVDGNGNINTSGGLTANGPSTLNGQVNANNGFNAQNINVPGQIVAQSITVQNLQVTGNLSKPQGTFKIDHPLDPANKFLYHSFVESPDMMNIYNGVVVLNKKGEAVVQLPDYFEALNQDFRYQLTSIGRFMPVYIAQKISGNRFKVAGGKPGMEVSWQVTGIRHDAYAEAHRIVVEEDKGKERGTYLHPELFQKDPVVARK